MKSNYNLTTKKGFKEALDIFDECVWPVSPIVSLLKKGFDKMFSPETSTETQAEVARNLIVEGKKQGVKKMQIKVGHKAGVDLGTDIDGIPIKIKAGNSGDMDVFIEYA